MEIRLYLDHVQYALINPDGMPSGSTPEQVSDTTRGFSDFSPATAGELQGSGTYHNPYHCISRMNA